MDLDVFIEGKTIVDVWIAVDIVFSDGSRMTVTDDLNRFKVREGLVYMEIKGRFNYVKLNKWRIDLIRFSIATKKEGAVVER